LISVPDDEENAHDDACTVGHDSVIVNVPERDGVEAWMAPLLSHDIDLDAGHDQQQGGVAVGIVFVITGKFDLRVWF